MLLGYLLASYLKWHQVSDQLAKGQFSWWGQGATIFHSSLDLSMIMFQKSFKNQNPFGEPDSTKTKYPSGFVLSSKVLRIDSLAEGVGISVSTLPIITKSNCPQVPPSPGIILRASTQRISGSTSFVINLPSFHIIVFGSTAATCFIPLKISREAQAKLPNPAPKSSTFKGVNLLFQTKISFSTLLKT